MRPHPRPRLLILHGSTGTGKTSLSLHYAHTLNGEIINADAMQTYNALHIATNQIQKAQQKNITHHLLGSNEPYIHVDVRVWVEKTKKLIKEIRERGKMPILCGMVQR